MVGLLLAALLTPVGQAFFALDMSDPAAVGTALAVAGVAAAIITVIRVVDARWLSRERDTRDS